MARMAQMLFKREVDDNLSVCPKAVTLALRAVERLKMTFDDEQWQELDAG
jgi:acetyl-CoA carboxylase beta subunit